MSALHRLGLDKATPLHLDQALVLCRRFAAEVRAADLFSANEEAEDLATADIKYLLAPFFLAELLNSLPISSAPIGPESSPPETGPAQRMLKVEEALMLYTAFLDSCRQYGLLGQTGRQLYLQDAQQVCNCRHVLQLACVLYKCLLRMNCMKSGPQCPRVKSDVK